MSEGVVFGVSFSVFSLTNADNRIIIIRGETKFIIGCDYMQFEWDEEKDLSNQRKHHISFSYASLVFNDEFRLEYYDEFHSDDESRYNVIGMVGTVIFVVCVYKSDDVVRIISAREATKKEKRRYYGYC